MTQADFTIANQTFPNTRTELNTSLQALATNSAGNSAPSTTFASQWWFDSDDNKLYMRNKDNDAWVEILTIGATSDAVESIGATGRFDIASTETVFNESSANIDLRIESDSNANRFKLDAADDVIVMGTATVEDSIYGAKPALQLTGTDFNSSAFSMIRNAADANSPNLIFGKSRSADGNTVVQDGDDLGNITFAAADGTDQNNTAARIYAEVDGTPGANDTPGRLVFATTADGANSATERLRITNAGQIGIGCTPSATLHVDASGGGVIRVSRNSVSTANYMALESDGTDGTVKAIKSLFFSAGGSERMKIDLEGNLVFNDGQNDCNFRIKSDDLDDMLFVDAGNNRIGIGSDSPSEELHIKTESGNCDVLVESTASNQDAKVMMNRNGSSGKALTRYHDSNTSAIWYAGLLQFSNQFAIGTGDALVNSQMFNIDSSGRTSLGNILQSTYGGRLNATQGSGAALAAIASINSVTSGTARQIDFFQGTATGRVGSIESTPSSVAFNTSSDYRLKENITYDFDATTRLKQLKPSRFNFIADADKTIDGFLAHEVSDIVPEAISGEKDETETKEKVVVNSNGNVIAEGIEEADWVTGKSDILWTSDDIETQDVLYTSDDVETQDVLYTEEDELPEGVEVDDVKESATKSVGDIKQKATQTVGDVKTKAIYPADSTWEASKVIPVYQGIDQSKLVPLLVKTIQELEARITALES